MKEQIILNLLGTADWLSFAFSVLWATVGIYVIRISFTATRDPLKDKSPIHFSFSYFICDNVWPFLRELSLAVIFIRFSENLIGEKGTMYVSFGIGLVANLLPMYFVKMRDGIKAKLGIKDGDPSKN